MSTLVRLDLGSPVAFGLMPRPVTLAVGACKQSPFRGPGVAADRLGLIGDLGPAPIRIDTLSPGAGAAVILEFRPGR
jgi:hypothetical protein